MITKNNIKSLISIEVIINYKYIINILLDYILNIYTRITNY